jgi:hypothetical protein
VNLAISELYVIIPAKEVAGKLAFAHDEDLLRHSRESDAFAGVTDNMSICGPLFWVRH